MPPYPSYLVHGTVYNPNGYASSNAGITIVSSLGRKILTTDSNGLFLFDLADLGYISGETVSVSITDEFNNYKLDTSFIVAGSFLETDFTLTLRTEAISATDYSPKTILHSVGKKVITSDNPLSVKGANFLESFFISDQIASGDTTYFGYINKDGRWYIQKQDQSVGTYRYAKGSSDYATNFTNRTTLDYDYFDEVFG